MGWVVIRSELIARIEEASVAGALVRCSLNDFDDCRTARRVSNVLFVDDVRFTLCTRAAMEVKSSITEDLELHALQLAHRELFAALCTEDNAKFWL